MKYFNLNYKILLNTNYTNQTNLLFNLNYKKLVKNYLLNNYNTSINYLQ